MIYLCRLLQRIYSDPLSALDDVLIRKLIENHRGKRSLRDFQFGPEQFRVVRTPAGELQFFTLIIGVAAHCPHLNSERRSRCEVYSRPSAASARNLHDRETDLVYEKRHEARKINVDGVAHGVGNGRFACSRGDGV